MLMLANYLFYFLPWPSGPWGRVRRQEVDPIFLSGGKMKGAMPLNTVIDILTHHQKWRKGAEIEMSDPRLLSDALEQAILWLKHEHANIEAAKEWKLDKNGLVMLDKTSLMCYIANNAD